MSDPGCGDDAYYYVLRTGTERNRDQTPGGWGLADVLETLTPISA